MGAAASRRSSRRLRLAGLVLGFITALACPAAAAEKVVLQLKWKHAFQFAGYYAALEQGYYQAAGLDVVLKEGGPETKFAAELESGGCEYAVALSSMLLDRAHGRPVVALAAILQHSPEVLLVPAASGINTPHQMAGRTVAVSPDDTPALLAMFKNEGIAAGAVKTVPYQFDIEKMKRRDFDGMGAYSTNEPFLCQEQGLDIHLIQPRDYGVDFYGDCLFTSDHELRKNPRRVKAFLDASLAGWRYAMHHREETISLILSKYEVKISREALRFEADKMAELMFADLIDVGHMNEGRWRHIGDTYVRLGMLPPDYSLKDFLYQRDARESLAWLWWTVGGTSACTLLLTGTVLFLMRVNGRIASAERQARQAQTMVRTILNTIPVGVFWKGRDGGYLGCNRVFADYVGLPAPEQIQGMKGANLPEGWDMNATAGPSDDEVMDEGRPVLLAEHELASPGGGIRHLHASKVPLRDETGATVGLLGVVEDITALKETEAHQARLKERLHEAQKYESLQRLTNGVCHHFNNILQSVIGYAELARMQLAQQPLLRRHMDGVLSESQRAAALNRMLLTSIGHGHHKMGPVELAPFLEASLPALRASLPERHTLRWLGGTEATTLQADEQSLSQLLVNLVTNASEALDEAAGDIQLHQGRIACDAAYLQEPYLDPPPPPGEYAFIDVIDRGCGMPGDVLKTVFDPFFSTKFPGRGLGLTSALGIVKSHGGAIKINSLPGKGTTVRVLLPLGAAG